MILTDLSSFQRDGNSPWTTFRVLYFLDNSAFACFQLSELNLMHEITPLSFLPGLRESFCQHILCVHCVVPSRSVIPFFLLSLIQQSSSLIYCPHTFKCLMSEQEVSPGGKEHS